MKKLFYFLIVYSVAIALLFTTTSAQAQGGGPFRGNLSGSDGKVSSELMALHREYQAHLQSGRTLFHPTTPLVQVIGNRVVIDAAAARDPQTLRRDLEALGLRNAAVAGRLVSGQLPIAAIPSLNRVGSLQSVRAAYAITTLR
jgi:hypothetical protein